MDKKEFTIANLSKQINTIGELTPLIPDLETNKESIEKVTFTGNSYAVEPCITLGHILNQCHKLKVANFSDMFVGRLKSEVPKSLVALCEGVMDKQIEELDMSDNAMGPVGVESIESLLIRLKTMKKLLIANNGLGPEGGERLAMALLKSESNLETIEIGRNRLEIKGAKGLAKMISEKKSFVSINVQQNGIKKDGMLELLASIKLNPNLEELFLNDNWIKGEVSLGLLQNIFESCPKLRVLNLSDNNIGDSISKEIFTLIGKYLPNIESIYYNYNELESHEALSHILKILLKDCPKLKVVELEGNNIPLKMVEEYSSEFTSKGVKCTLRGEDEEEEDDD